MKIEYEFSTADIADVLKLLNEFLKHISLVALSRDEVDKVISTQRCIGGSNSKYSNIVKVINRWGIKEEKGNYYELLNDVIGKISSCYSMLQIYKPIQLLVFNKLLEGGSKGVKPKFTGEEIEIFFLQPAKMLMSDCIPGSAVYLYDLITELQNLYERLKVANSKKFLNEGVSRRLFMLKATVDSISKMYNERRIKCLDGNENTILSQDINLFYANIYAILDCLAFVFAYEYPGYKIVILRDVALFNKKFYPKINGLNEKLSLTKLKPWYDEIVKLRDPIAHRIPLYFPEIYKKEDARKIKEIRDEYSKSFNAIFMNRRALTNDENDQIDKLREKRQKAESNINVFSGCFLHSYEESEKNYHLSRLTLDLGILYYLLDKSFEYLCELCGKK